MRESVSAQLDGELAELEFECQRAHLRVCADCSAWAEGVQSATQWLREASFEEPASGFALPRPRRKRGTAPIALVAAAAASLVALLGTAQTLTPSSSKAGRWSDASAPAVAGLEVQRLGLTLAARLPTDVAQQGKFRAV